jgi:hypothetical protein
MKKFSLEELQLMENYVLKRSQMEKIKEGDKYFCTCIGSVGAWTGVYNSKDEILNAIQKWCESGKGSCKPTL